MKPLSTLYIKWKQLFVHQLAIEIVQNHKDAPNMWSINYNTKLFENKKHKIFISFYSNWSLYRIELNNIEIASNTLGFFSKRYLSTYFSSLRPTYTVPTKAVSPEHFI